MDRRDLRLVVDSNIFVAALLRDGATRRQIMLTPDHLFVPPGLRTELKRNLPLLSARSGQTVRALGRVLNGILARVTELTLEDIEPHMAKAAAIMVKRDATDSQYLAAAFAIKADAIWSRDRDFDVQDLVPRIERLPE